MPAGEQKMSERLYNELREVRIARNFIREAEGSALIEFGNTKVICTASIEEHVPSWMKGRGEGWLTAEYGMLPKCSKHRISRDKHLSSGRTKEIQRLIGRALRSVVDLHRLGERTLLVDCDVIGADGGTRTASINGAMVAVCDAFLKLRRQGVLAAPALTDMVGAVSVGIVKGRCFLDLDYELDSAADVDMNVVMTAAGRYVEIQGTAEKNPYTHGELMEMLALARIGIEKITDMQKVLYTPEELALLF